MSRAIAAARPSTESAVAAGQLPTRQSRKPRRPKLIDAPRQSKPCQHVDQRQLSLRSAASSHPDCRAVLIQIVAQYTGNSCILINELPKGCAEATRRTGSKGAVGRHSLTSFFHYATWRAARSRCASRHRDLSISRVRALPRRLSLHNGGRKHELHEAWSRDLGCARRFDELNNELQRRDIGAA